MTPSLETRNDSYGLILDDLSRQHSTVLEAIRALGNDATIAEVANYLDWEKSTVSGRMNELRKEQGLLLFNGKRICRVSGKRVCAWKAVAKQLEMQI